MYYYTKYKESNYKVEIFRLDKKAATNFILLT